MRTWTLRHRTTALGVTLIAGIVIGVPTGVVPTPFYARMAPVLWWNYPVWAISSALEGLLIARFLRIPSVASLVLLAHALVRRLRAVRECPVPANPRPTTPPGYDDAAAWDSECREKRGERSDRATAR